MILIRELVREKRYSATTCRSSALKWTSMAAKASAKTPGTKAAKDSRAGKRGGDIGLSPDAVIKEHPIVGDLIQVLKNRVRCCM